MSAEASSSNAGNLKPIQVKLVLLGEAAVGKSSLVLRFVNGDFQDNKEPTIGAAFLTQKCKLEDKIIKFEIWDTAGRKFMCECSSVVACECQCHDYRQTVRPENRTERL